MKKILTLILSICMLVSLFALATSAAEVDFVPSTFYAAKGTPAEIDGVMDDAYNLAPVIDVAAGYAGTSNRRTPNKVALRILWDENYLYAFYTITDPYVTPEAHEKQWTSDYTNKWGFWNGDSVETYVNTSGSKPTDYRTAGVEGCGCYITAVNHGLSGTNPIPANDAILKANEGYYKTVITEDGWNLEIKIKFEGYVGKADDVIGFAALVNCDDKPAEKTPGSGNYATREYKLYTSPDQDPYQDATNFDMLVLSVDPPVTEPPTTEAPTTEAPTTEAPTTEAPTTEAPTTKAPTTTPTTPSEQTTSDPTTPGDSGSDSEGDAGCASSIGMVTLFIPTLAGAWLFLRKKEQ